MPFAQFQTSSGAEIEVETLSFAFRMPPRPARRQLSCLVVSHGNTAELKIAASFNDKLMPQALAGAEEVLRALGFVSYEYEHKNKLVTREL